MMTPDSVQKISFAEATSEPMITPSDVIEYTFCPRFVYFMHCLKIPQNEERRFKVMAGREIHQRKLVRNRGYIRKKIGCVLKEEDVYLASSRLKIRGRIDELLSLSDGSLAPLDYKFAEYKKTIHKTLQLQIFLYAGLIMEQYNKQVTRGFLCFVRSSNKIIEIPVTREGLQEAWKAVNEVFDIIYRDYFPRKTNSRQKCLDCTYKNICAQ
ncbi:MAG: CRISPR-associated protein Cas4 [Thermodesulfobacteriota bacterium]|nr:CRISPR-associated protein Cas4 [Thermodesulfobacteriota bacterium]